MNKARLLTAAITTAAAGAAGLAGAASAWADDADAAMQPPGVQQLGQQGQIANGASVEGWTVSGLQPSADPIPYQPDGALWEATATDQALAGGAIPFIPAFSARAANGDDYRSLFQVPTAQGVNPTGLAQGQSTTGKLYFDVTGESPDSVVYTDGGQDRLTWVQPPPSAEGVPATGYSPASAWPGSGYYGQTVPVAPQTGTATTAPAAVPAATAPAAAGQGTAQAVPAKPAPAAAADDVHGAATAAQPKPTATQLDVHDTTAPAAAPAQAPSAQGGASAPAAAPAATAPAPASSAPAPTAAATPAPAAAPTVPVVPPTKAPAPAS
jgi:hypothetical protein